MKLDRVVLNGEIDEINAQPKQLDLNDIYAKYVKESGIKFALSTDAHNTATLQYMKYAIFQRRHFVRYCQKLTNNRTLCLNNGYLQAKRTLVIIIIL